MRPWKTNTCFNRHLLTQKLIAILSSSLILFMNFFQTVAFFSILSLEPFLLCFPFLSYVSFAILVSLLYFPLFINFSLLLNSSFFSLHLVPCTYCEPLALPPACKHANTGLKWKKRTNCNKKERGAPKAKEGSIKTTNS